MPWTVCRHNHQTHPPCHHEDSALAVGSSVQESSFVLLLLGILCWIQESLLESGCWLGFHEAPCCPVTVGLAGCRWWLVMRWGWRLETACVLPSQQPPTAAQFKEGASREECVSYATRIVVLWDVPRSRRSSVCAGRPNRYIYMRAFPPTHTTGQDPFTVENAVIATAATTHCSLVFDGNDFSYPHHRIHRTVKALA